MKNAVRLIDLSLPSIDAQRGTMKLSSLYKSFIAVALITLALGGSYFVADSQTHINSLQGMAADGSAVAGFPLRIAGKDGSGNTQDIITDSSGELQIDVLSIAAGNNNIGDVDVASSALPTGAATSANQSTEITALQLIDNIVFTEDTATADQQSGVPVFARRTATPANQSGTDGDLEWLQISAGRLWASATITDLIPGVGATNLGKAIDSAAGPTDTGVALLGIRDDALSTLTPAEGDWVPPRFNSVGAMWVAWSNPLDDAIDSIRIGDGTTLIDVLDLTNSNPLVVAIVDGDGNQIPSIGGGTQYTEGDTDSAITGTALMMEGATNTLVVAPGTVANGLLVDVSRIQGTVTVGSHAVTNGGTFAVQESGAALTALQLIDNVVQTEDTATADQQSGVPVFARRTATPANQSGTDGDLEWLQINAGRLWTSATIDAALPAGNNNIGDVDLASAIPAGNNNIGDVDIASFPDNEPFNLAQLGGSALVTGGAAGTLGVGGIAAHDAVGTSINPLLMGLLAVAHGANPTAVAASDLTRWLSNRAGIPFVSPGHPNIITRSVLVTDADGAQTNAAFVSVSAGTKIVVTGVEALADNDNTGNVAVKIGFGTSTLPASALAGTNGILLEHPDVAAGSGVSKGFTGGIVGIGADDEDIRFTVEDPAGGNLTITISYYTIES